MHTLRTPFLKTKEGTRLFSEESAILLVSKYPAAAAAAAAAAKSLQSCPTLCDPIDGSPPGSAVPGILQARTLEWVAIGVSKFNLESNLGEACGSGKKPMQVCP